MGTLMQSLSSTISLTLFACLCVNWFACVRRHFGEAERATIAELLAERLKQSAQGT